jgi:hypothetical protein
MGYELEMSLLICTMRLLLGAARYITSMHKFLEVVQERR